MSKSCAPRSVLRVCWDASVRLVSTPGCAGSVARLEDISIGAGSFIEVGKE